MLILSAIVNGILYGGTLAVLAVGLNLMFGVLKVIHFFYGQLVMVGLYLIWAFTVWCQIPLIISCLLAIAAVLALNVLAHLAVVRPLLKAPLINQFLALAGIMVILENLCLAVFGATYKGIPISLPVLHIGELYLTTSNLLAFLGSLIIVGLIYLFLNKTYPGLAIRAVSQDKEAAGFMGIDPKVTYLVTMALGGALAGIVAALFVPIYAVHPHFGGSFTVISFVIVVLGGMGSLPGGLLAAFIIGVVTSVVSTLVSPEVGAIAVYLIFLTVILVRPQGLLGKAVRA